MGRGTLITLLRWVSLAMILAAVILAFLQYQVYQQSRGVIPARTQIADIQVGGLTRDQAAQRLTEAYSTPVELRFQQAVILLKPSEVGFELNLESMLAEADENTRAPVWSGFLQYLQGKTHAAAQIELRAKYSEDQLKQYLNSEIVPRYDQPAVPPQPIVGTVNFRPAKPGLILDANAAVPRVERALFSLSDRAVDLPLQTVPAPPPALENLEILVKQTSDRHGFDGLVGFFLQHLSNHQQLSFAYRQGQSYHTDPDVAFTAASIMKIPIMVSVFRRLEGAPDAETDKLLTDMIQESGNEAADWVMQRIIDPDFAPLEVSEDMLALGLENTFLAGYFYQGAPILQIYDTPANRRNDLSTDPDIYSQTTPSDMGILLQAIYTCGQAGDGLLVDTFSGEITQTECQSMLTYLAGNKTPYLIEAGVPEIIDVIHKHGWVSYLGVINAIGDAAVVYTPGGDYVLVIFTHDEDGLLWEPTSALVANLSQAVYNFYNLPEQ
jgi:beta-lactamase class A